MEDFLWRSSAAATTSFHGNPRVHVVLGSESCDLDSVVSSLAMAYFLSRTSSGLSGSSLVLPVLNIPRSQFHLQADVLLLLRESGITTESLVFRDQVDLARLHGERRLVLTLVDHSVLQSTDSCLEGAVVEVIDHHQLQRTASFFCPVTAETVASCATLVTERILSSAPEILDRQLALLLYGVVVMDSVNQVGGGSVRSRQMLRRLQKQFPDLPHGGALHTSLHTAKFDLSGLSTEHILLKDMKLVAEGDVRVAVSSIFLSLESFLGRKNLQQELQDVCLSHQLDAVVAMTISFNDQSEKPVRHLALYSQSSRYRRQISHALLNSWSPSPCLSPVSSPYKDILAYHLGDALASRSKLIPVLTHFLSDRWQREMHCGADGGEESEDPLDQSMMISEESSADSASGHQHWLQLEAEDHGMADEQTGGRMMPPAPMNSLVDGCPLDGVFNQEALLEKFRWMGGVEEEDGRHPEHV
ncbi:exopolyphosphatase PRUNE1-like isoform X1 [Acanthopagrus latus]|uniref:exopolyphosphatase PRUNE1-like isoform X1 n=1 Tax=Acanthopagrus latus TaxID=8177 RepID=UPI00187C7534|nr:exopolyphosphatase PRUNE1-like isoform X1 [Acanthopagrus latus]